VEQVVGAPVINRFTVDPHQIQVGQCVDIRWEVQGSVDRVKLLRNNVAIWDGAPTSGTFQDCPPGAGEMSYLLEANGPGGTSRLQRVVTVVQPDPGPTATPIPTPTPGPEPPESRHCCPTRSRADCDADSDAYPWPGAAGHRCFRGQPKPDPGG
jgi:hypothetical protein